jgi:hypothetical protein
MTMAKLSMMIKCTLSAVHINGCGGPPVQYEAHCLMQHVQGYSGSHWTPPLGAYSLHIAPAAAKATGKQQQSTNTPKEMAILMAEAVRRYYTVYFPMEAVPGFVRSH